MFKNTMSLLIDHMNDQNFFYSLRVFSMTYSYLIFYLIQWWEGDSKIGTLLQFLINAFPDIYKWWLFCLYKVL